MITIGDLGSHISSTETDVRISIGKVGSDRLITIWKSDFSEK